MSDTAPAEAMRASAPNAQPPSEEFHGQPSAILNWSKTGAELASRRSQALADYWTALAAVRQPEEAVAVQMDYWNHWIDDYVAAAVEVMTPFTGPPAKAPTAH
jgi:hypothetical protein